MKHTSVSINSPIEFIDIQPINSLISKCQIKVCYVGDEPNRNRSIITKETARQMANSLPGCPIVGYYNEDKEDFEEHNRIIEISNGEFKIKDTTRPYGFVDLNPKVWFEKFRDDNETEHEYLCTEGWLWTKVYPEVQRVITHGNNQSMELDEETLKADWTEDDKGRPEFFIINEALISKLCILGEDNEPCFEGSQINSSFSLKYSEVFEQKLFAMMNEIQQYLKEGGTKVFTVYAVNVGDALWTSLYSHLEATYPDTENFGQSVYSISGVYEDEGQKFAIVQNTSDSKYYRLNFSISEDNVFSVVGELTEETNYEAPEAPLFAVDLVESFIADYAKKKKDEEDEKGKTGEDDNKGNEDNSESEEEDDDEEKKKKKKKYSLDEVVEYQELLKNYAALESKVATLESEKADLESKLAPLVEFKNASERKDKEAMIATFYMLSDEDKKDVIDNIDTYSLEDIESKLSVICVRKKVNFSQEDDDNSLEKGATVYNLGSNNGDEQIPAWVKAALNVAKNLEN